MAKTLSKLEELREVNQKIIETYTAECAVLKSAIGINPFDLTCCEKLFDAFREKIITLAGVMTIWPDVATASLCPIEIAIDNYKGTVDAVIVACKRAAAGISDFRFMVKNILFMDMASHTRVVQAAEETTRKCCAVCDAVVANATALLSIKA